MRAYFLLLSFINFSVHYTFFANNSIEIWMWNLDSFPLHFSRKHDRKVGFKVMLAFLQHKSQHKRQKGMKIANDLANAIKQNGVQ